MRDWLLRASRRACACLLAALALAGAPLTAGASASDLADGFADAGAPQSALASALDTGAVPVAAPDADAAPADVSTFADAAAAYFTQGYTPRRRALLVGCDDFLTVEDTWPSAEGNVAAVHGVLTDAMAFEEVRVESGTISSPEELAAVVQEVFGEADARDISYFYISTHGLYDAALSNLDAALVLSNGLFESTVDARTLEAMFSRVRGTKILMIDACNSGALIGKGVSGGALGAAFVGDDYKVLTSAGGSEESWYYASASDGGALPDDADAIAPRVSGYFSTALVHGLGREYGYPADANRDGTVTLSELYEYLLLNHAASTPQVYPQSDDTPILTYELSALPEASAPVMGVTFDNAVLTMENPSVSFSFTVRRDVQIAYQIVYFREGRWQFERAQLLYDNTENPSDDPLRQGVLSRGRKERSLSLNLADTNAYGYAMVQLLSFEDGQADIHASRVVCVPPASAAEQLSLSVVTGASFQPARWREMPIVVSHRSPCRLSVRIVNLRGETVRRIAYRQPTRPQHLTPAGSTFYWDGCDDAGELLEPDEYRVIVDAFLGDTVLVAVSQRFSLMETSEGQPRTRPTRKQ